MKNAKLSKLFVLVLSLALLIGSAIGIAASAAETDDGALEIEAINVSYGDRIIVLIAVAEDQLLGDSVPEADIEVSYTYNGENYTAKRYTGVYLNYGATTDDTADDTKFPIYYTVGISAKQMTKDIIAEAHIKGTTPAAPGYMKTSVGEYLYTRLYRPDLNFIAKTEGDDLLRKNFYLSALEYGAYAQEVLTNIDAAEGAKEVLVTDYRYVYVTDGTVEGYTQGIFTATSTVTPVHNGLNIPEGQELVGWTAQPYDVNGNALTEVEYSLTDEIPTENHLILTPKFSEPWYGDATGDFYKNDTITGIRIDYDADGATVPGNGSYTDLSVTINDGALNCVRTGTSGESYVRWNVSSNTHVTPVLIFEADVKFANFSVTTPSKIMLDANNAKTQITISHTGDNITMIPANPSTGAAVSGGGSVTIPENEWVNLRLELDYANSKIEVFVNNVHAGTLSNIVTTSTSSSRILWYQLKAEGTGSIYIDNMFYGFVEDGTAISAE